MQWKRLVSAPPKQSCEELKKVGSAKRKTPHPASGGFSKVKMKKVDQDSAKTCEKEAESDGNKQKDVGGNKVESSKKSPSVESSEKSDVSPAKTEKPMKASSIKNKADKLSDSAKATSNKLNEFNMFEKLGEERKEKKRRPKTAKTYTSKFRSTGTVLVQVFIFILCGYHFVSYAVFLHPKIAVIHGQMFVLLFRLQFLLQACEKAG